MKRWLDKVEVADNAYQRARETARRRSSELSAIYSAAKDDGINVDALKEARKQHRKDHIVVAQDYKDIGRFLRLMKSPLAVQLDLFSPPNWPESVKAGFDGKLAGRNGEPIDNCPYPAGSDTFIAWRDNWEAGQKELRDQLRS